MIFIKNNNNSLLFVGSLNLQTITKEYPLEVRFPSAELEMKVALNKKGFPRFVVWAIGTILANSLLHIGLEIKN